MKKLCFAVYVFLAALFISVNSLTAQDVLLPEEESPATFYEASLDSDEVDLFFSGSWQINLTGTVGFGWTETDGFDGDLSPSASSEGFSFSQSPDMTVSLLILEKILFETAFTDEFDESTFRLGYIGSEDEFVQSVSIGNMGIDLDDSTVMSDYFYVPGGGYSSYGIHSLMQGPFSEHELLFRFDPQEELSKLYIGSDVLVEIEMLPSEYLQGFVFYVPDSPFDAVFYFETGEDDADTSITINGEVRYFRELESSEYSYSSSDGRLLIEDASDDSTDGAICVSSAEAGHDMLFLMDPGVYTGYEAFSAYDLNTVLPDASWKTRVFLSDCAETASTGLELDTEIFSDDGIVIIGPASGGSLKYPLEGVLPYPEKIYGADAVTDAETSDQKLYFRIREDSSGYSVDDPVSGSIRIYINGVETDRWSESGGTITFDTDPGDSDYIEIVYRKDTRSDGGDLLFASANRFTITPELTADINAGVRWNISEGYVYQGEETSAWAGVSSGIGYSSSNEDTGLSIDAELRGGVKILVENSAGRLMLKDMSADTLDVSLTGDTVFPASLSDGVASSYIPDLTADDRGILLYTEYRTESAFGGYYLQDYTTAVDDDMVLSPVDSTTGNMLPAGPCTASASSDDRSGEVVIMDYIMNDPGSWTGIQIPLNTSEGSLDLSSSSALTFDYKTGSGTDLSDIELYVEIGSMSEDLDGDGSLDAEASEYSDGWVFNDPNSPAGTLIGGDYYDGNNGELDTEDINGNDFSDSEKTDAVVIFRDIAKPDTDWKRLRLYFTDASGDSSRARLKNAEFIRITAVNTATGENEGRIIFDDFTLEGVSFTAYDDSGYVQPELTEIDEILMPTSEQADEYLSTPTIDSTADNRLMRVEWTDDWKIYSYISPVDADSYDSLVFSWYCPEITQSGVDAPELSVSLTDGDGFGIDYIETIKADGSWHTVTIDTSDAGIDSDADELSLLEFAIGGADDGILYIDEIYLGDPVWQTSGGLSASADLTAQNPLLTLGGVEILGPASITNDAEASVTADGGETSFDYTANAQVSILGADVSADFTAADPDDLYLEGGHSISIPVSAAVLPFSLLFSDSFSMDNSSDGDYSGSDSINFEAGIFSAEAGFGSSLDSGQLNRSWTASIDASADVFSTGLSSYLLLSDQNKTISRAGYFNAWYSAAALAADFSSEDLIERKWTFELAAALNTEPMGFSLDAGISSDIDENNNADTGAELIISLPFSFRLPGSSASGSDLISTEFSYSRSAEFGFENSSEGFSGDLSQMLEALGSGGILYSSIPFYELFDDSLPQDLYSACTDNDIDTALFDNEARFSLSRSYSSRLIDLLLPYSLDAGLSRSIEKDYLDTEDSLILDIAVRNAALNLFGSAGVYQFFDFYFSDELNWSVETEIEAPFSDEISADTVINGGLSIFGNNDDIFSLDFTTVLPFNSEDTDNTTDASAMYIWNLDTDRQFDLPLFSPEEEALQIITNEETVSIGFDDSFTAEIKHMTSFMLPGTLTLSAFGLVDFEYSSDDDNESLLFGLSLGISGSIIY